ncbi:MAG: hypothetical protein IJW45_00845 [Oscillospiraceae bacterium]|nr:hypothetical protein [Oscillospiraceae bacterium]
MDWKKIGNKLLFPPIWLMALLTVVSAGLLITVFVKGWEETPIAYGAYVLSFYTLSVVTVFCVLVLPKQYEKIKKKIYDHPFGNRYMTDRAFRTKVSLYLSLGINLLYVGTNLWSWYLNRSWWFVVLAVYYVIMAMMRFLLVGYVRKNQIGSSVLGEWRRSRICAYILLLVNLSLSGAVLMILYQNRGSHYPGMMIYVMAMYTFYSTTHAIIDMVKYRKLGSPVMSTAKIVSLSAALVSMLNLETAMFAQFGAEMSVEHQRIFIILTGAGVSITVVTLSVLLIVKATKEIKHGKE